MMPAENMRQVTRRMVEHDWFSAYGDLGAIAESLDRVAARIRFPNQFDNAIEDLVLHRDYIRDGFLEFYPQLQQHVRDLAIEAD